MAAHPTLNQLPPTLTTDSPSAGPLRKIFDADDMQLWLRSEAYAHIEAFINRLRTASEQEQKEPSQAIKLVVEFLERCGGWIEEATTSGSPASRGKAFIDKNWLARVTEASAVLNRDLTSSSQAGCVPELEAHLASSFGSPVRLDYGTGHELAFLCYLLTLRLAGVFTVEDEPAIVKAFSAYRDLVDKLQKEFKLEPAGKMGVWGLDEHGRLVYHSGASQSRVHASAGSSALLSPPSMTPTGVAHLYLSSLLHLNSNFDPSRTSDSIDGLFHLYCSEVLQRLPVVQHLRFGEVLRWVDAKTGERLTSSGDGLCDEERETLTSELDQRERDSGTVAPWALPSLSGVQTPDEVLSRLPSPVAASASRPGSPKKSSPPSPRTLASATASGTNSPLPRPHSACGLGQRRMSRLSIAESLDGEEVEEK
ncbi:hypothetical protein JCM10213_008373 [Rhodosporidiobolus nylandii]